MVLPFWDQTDIKRGMLKESFTERTDQPLFSKLEQENGSFMTRESRSKNSINISKQKSFALTRLNHKSKRRFQHLSILSYKPN